VISLVLLGAAGRMGRAVEEASASADDMRIKAKIDQREPAAVLDTRSAGPGSAPAGYGQPRPAGGPSGATRDELIAALEPGDVVVDFSSPAGTRDAALACAERGAALVSGTTGLERTEEEALKAAARRVPILRAANFSLGVLALRRALATALASLPGDWDIEIVERHHRLKADSPSGTALLLGREAARQRGYAEFSLRVGREGRVGPRPGAEIGVHAVRGGSWVGDHAVLLAGSGEWLELRHVAQDRGAFARGAIAAARFVATASPGLYTLDDLLHLPS
jgi:4-hydroxy-tetrahydrodipicolinate reductase